MRILSVTAQRNEGPYLIEWLAWHRMLGVTDFLIYSNDCDDAGDLLLDALMAHGVLRHEPNNAPEGKSLQWSALKQAWKEPVRKDADWMLISDIDEFPVIHAGAGRLADLIGALPSGTDAVALPWRLFGASGIAQFQDRPVISQFTRSAPVDMVYPVAATMFKSLFRPEAFARPGVHRPRNRKEGAAKWASGSGGTMTAQFAESDGYIWTLNQPDARQLAEMHHYSLRSAEGFLVKSERGLPNRSHKEINAAYWVERNFNTVENRAAMRLLPDLEQEIAVLKSLPGIAERHEACVAWHRQRIQHLLGQRDSLALFGQLLLAGDSRVMSIGYQRHLIQLTVRAVAKS